MATSTASSPTPVSSTPDGPSSRPWWGKAARRAPFALVVVGLVSFLAFGGGDHVSLEAAAARQSELRAWADSGGWRAGAVFVAAYAGLAAISLPGALWFTIVGGLIFGWGPGAAYSWLGALGGATMAFFAARLAAEDVLRGVVARRGGPRVAALQAGIARDGFLYMLAARLIPAPFFLVNLAAAATPVRPATYVAATAVGLIPASIVYAALGAATADTLDAGEGLRAGDVLRPEIAAGFLGLAVMALAPLAARRFGFLSNR